MTRLLKQQRTESRNPRRVIASVGVGSGSPSVEEARSGQRPRYARGLRKCRISVYESDHWITVSLPY
jgi:hypothetical protein